MCEFRLGERLAHPHLWGLHTDSHAYRRAIQGARRPIGVKVVDDGTCQAAALVLAETLKAFAVHPTEFIEEVAERPFVYEERQPGIVARTPM